MSSAVKTKVGWSKCCSSCKNAYRALSLSTFNRFFGKNRSRADGMSTTCRKCCAKIGSKYGHSRMKKLKRPQAHAAQTKLNNALASGKIIKSPCRDCGKTKVDGHHSDYSKPLEVIWLCRKHHAAEHERMRNE